MSLRHARGMASTFVPLGVQLEEEEAEESQPIRDKVVALINNALTVKSNVSKLDCLHQVKELVVKKEPGLLDGFLEEVFAFHQDPSPDVRKFVISFNEDACKSDNGLVVRVVPLLSFMVEDKNTNVIKRLMTCLMQLYKMALMYVAKLKTVEEDAQEMWEILQDIKLKLCDFRDSDNDGIRTLAIKFMEVLILGQTKKEADSEAPKGAEVDISLDMILASHPFLKPSDLREEAGTAMGSLLELTASPTVSSVNLMTCISCLTNIAKQRPSFISTVLQTFELLYGNLPPHFVTSQVTSVRKQLKGQVLSLLRHPASFDCQEQITTLLTDLGCTQAEIIKNSPKVAPEGLKRSRPGDASESPSAKKQRMSLADTSAEAATDASEAVGEDRPAFLEAIEMTTSDLKPLLTPEAVIELVLDGMKRLPRHMPRPFKNSYTPIAAAGTEAQVTHLAKLLASQMTSAGLGIGAKAKGIQPSGKASESKRSRSKSPVVRDPRKRRREGRESREAGEGERSKRARPGEEEPEPPGPTPEPPVSVKQEPREEMDLAESMADLAVLGTLLGLPSITDPMFPLAYSAFFGSLPMESPRRRGGGGVKEEGESLQAVTEDDAPAVHAANLVAIPTTPTAEDSKEMAKKERKKIQPALPQKLKRIRMFDLSSVLKPLAPELQRRMSVDAFKRILGAERAAMQGGESQSRISLIITLVTQFGGEFNTTLLDFILQDLRAHFDLAVSWLYTEYCIAQGYLDSAQNNLQYDSCLTGLLRGAREKLDCRDRLFTRLVLEAPVITHSALRIVRSYLSDEDRAFLGISTLRDLVLRRPQATDDFLQVLLEATMSDVELARIQALHVAKKFYTKPDLAPKVERFALKNLEHLVSDHPVHQQQPSDMEMAVEWTEESVKMCLGLFVSLLTTNHKLLRDLSMVYISTSATVKRIILKQLDQPVRQIGMDSPDLLDLVQNCPQGAETLIMRMLHILTENAPPSPALVQRVRELYSRSSSDVRLLIPVLHGLQKHEVVAVLPKFIKLSPTLVKGVFDRLLVSYKGDQGHSISPVTPSELLIALHNIDCANDETLMKAVIKATNLCFMEKSVYTQEVLAVVLQQLLEQSPIPMLFMRTVIQSLGVCPKLLNFVMTILSKLITKQVWKQPKVWQGFIKCCEVTKPHSSQVLLQLPPRQLEHVLMTNGAIKISLVSHVHTLTPHQRACIPRSLLAVIERESGADMADKTGKRKTKDKSKKEALKKRRLSSRSDSSSHENVTPSSKAV